jgi:CRP-like cAMP-binding protein
MKQELIKFLSSYSAFSAEEVSTILELDLFRTYPKGTILLKEGEIAHYCYFVLKGCVRSYYLVDGQEQITEFYTENQPLTPVSYTTRIPSAYYLSCVEDCILSIATAQTNERLLQKLPKLELISRMVISEVLSNQQVSSDSFRTLSPQQRLAQLQAQRPDLCQRVPQYMLASYLGIKPESLSRIRKRMKDSKS